MLAVLAVLVMLATAVVPMASVSDGEYVSSGGADSWKVVLHTYTDDNGCEQLTVHLYKNGNEVTDLKSIAQDTPVGEGSVYTSSEENPDGSRKNVGSWGFDDEGYGPFNSFYAAFDPSNGNRMVCHLDPNDLMTSVDGDSTVTIDGEEVRISDCNIMWCLPTVWWGTDSEGNLVMASSKVSDDMEAYAHTVDGTTYSYLAIGVYESFWTLDDDGKFIFKSQSGMAYRDIAVGRESYRSNAQNLVVNTDGQDSGHAMVWNFYQYELYKYCALSVMGSWDSQTVAGNGSNNEIKAGTLDSSGPYAGARGSVTDKAVKVFLENVWGSCSEGVDGIVFDGTSGYYIDTSSVPTDSTTAGGNVTYVGISIPADDSGQKFGSAPSSDARIWGMPTALGGSSSTGLYDGIMASSDGKKHSLSIGGGSYTVTAGKAGISYFLDRNSLNDTFKNLCTRLAFVFGVDPIASVKYDHSQLESLLEKYEYSTGLISRLPDGETIAGKAGYEKLPDVPDEEGFRHVGWIIDGVQYPVEHPFVKSITHTAKSVWVGLPAVTYDHSQLVTASGDPDSVAGLSNGIEIEGHDGYEQLPDRDGFKHVGWLIGDTRVGPTDPFVKLQSHKAVSLWSEVPMVISSHSNLTDIVGFGAEGVSDLETSMLIEGNTNYPKLPDTAGYRHVGWDIGGKIVDPTAALESQETHDAKSLWEKISDSSDSFRPIPIFPDDEDDPIEIVIEKDSEPWLGRNGKSVLLLAVIAAIVAELAVLAISRKR